ncbi:Glutathione S-transferase S1 [Gracilariopsis chorda]|uniref:Glutathione S-transferase S1 n=1 Tax=Gracilariopsis chorda TaxID=448386 RepID=A0A2V3IEF0_9FLOR|nr:Glutathione S-transferase S1 [Gracilariopsis chorda]|eukprot:PXF40466.1 Glutathione S-transferase S1 [Gracilariopsis chorda]
MGQGQSRSEAGKIPSSLKLSYFDLGGRGGRGEPSRLALVLSNIEFEDYRFSYVEWQSIKPTTPYGAVPTLTIDGKQVAQSCAILRYVGKLGGLYPSDPYEALFVDEIIETMNDLNVATYSYLGPDVERIKEQRKELVEMHLPRFIGGLEKRLAEFGDGPFAVNGKLSVADLVVTCVVNSYLSGVYDYVPLDILEKYPKVLAIHKAVMELPKVVEWYEKHPIEMKTPKME